MEKALKNAEDLKSAKDLLNLERTDMQKKIKSLENTNEIRVSKIQSLEGE